MGGRHPGTRCEEAAFPLHPRGLAQPSELTPSPPTLSIQFIFSCHTIPRTACFCLHLIRRGLGGLQLRSDPSVAAGIISATSCVVAALPTHGACVGVALSVQDGGVVLEVCRGEESVDERYRWGQRDGRDCDI